MDVQQLAPWISLVASICSLVYVGTQMWRQPSHADGEPFPGDERRSTLGSVVARSQLFLLAAVSMLFFAAMLHYLLWLVSLSALAVPVWMFAAFVIVLLAIIETSPGETFEERVETFTQRVTPDEDVTVEIATDDETPGSDADE